MRKISSVFVVAFVCFLTLRHTALAQYAAISGLGGGKTMVTMTSGFYANSYNLTTNQIVTINSEVGSHAIVNVFGTNNPYALASLTATNLNSQNQPIQFLAEPGALFFIQMVVASNFKNISAGMK